LQQALGKHGLVADNRGPGRVAAQTCQVVLARLRVEVCDFALRLLAAQLGVTARDTAGPATVLGGLLARGGAVGLRVRASRALALCA
jgi:hypothetical protein